jgi:hypothetical protein
MTKPSREGGVKAPSKHPFWDRTHPRNHAWESQWEALVPDSGRCGTMEGELMRAASRIHYDFYNNGFGNNWSGALNYLDRYLGLPRPMREELARWSRGRVYPRHDYGDGEMDALLVELLESVLDKLDTGSATPNPCDMFDLQEPDDYGRYDEDEE